MSSRDVDLAEDLVPINEFRSRTSKLLDRITKEGRTLVFTQNGKAAAVVMSPRELDALRYRQRFVEEIARGVADVEAGRTQTTARVRATLRMRRREGVEGRLDGDVRPKRVEILTVFEGDRLLREDEIE